MQIEDCKPGVRVASRRRGLYEKIGTVIELNRDDNPFRARVKWDHGVRTWYRIDALHKMADHITMENL